MSAPQGPTQAPPGFERQGGGDVDRLAEAFYKRGSVPVNSEDGVAVPPRAIREAQAAKPEIELEAKSEPDPSQIQPEPGPEGAEPEAAELEGEGREEAKTESGEPDGSYVQVVVDGEERKVTVDELVKGYQQEASYTQRSQAMAEERRNFEAQRQAAAAELTDYYQGVEQLANQLRAEWMKAMPSPQEMDQLRQNDPAEWAARKEELKDREALLNAAASERQRLEQMQLQQRIPAERAALQQHPAFAGEKFIPTYREVGRWAVSPEGGGLSPDEWRDLIDHRHILLVWKAQQYDASASADKTRVIKAVSNRPRVVRPGTVRDPGSSDAVDFEKAKAGLEANPGSREAAAAAFLTHRRIHERDRERGRGLR